MAEANKYYGTGRRKNAIARVWVMPGTGNVTINKRELSEYFGKKTLEMIVRQPLVLTSTLDKYDVVASVHGGGTTGQAGAVRHGVARALVQADAELRPALKEAGFMTRDPRMKERRKYGLKKARKASQFSKLNFVLYRQQAVGPLPVFFCRCAGAACGRSAAGAATQSTTKSRLPNGRLLFVDNRWIIAAILTVQRSFSISRLGSRIPLRSTFCACSTW